MKTKTMKVGMMVLAVAAMSVGTVSCKKKGCTDPAAPNYDASAEKDDGSCEEPTGGSEAGVVQKYGAITADETWTANNTYVLNGKVVVPNGVTLTIEAGTLVKGAEGTGTLASALLVNRGGMIMANGTATNPIIFTSVLDNIQPGQLTGTNLTEADQGLWGGIVICGNAPTSAGDGDTETQIEGIPADGVNGIFGGTDANDNSGVLNYVSIRHGGALIGAGNEINGLTLGGVGAGTTISNIEVVANVDDGVEYFGGTVNSSNILVGFQGDDAIDIDMNYSGTVDNFVVVNGSNSDEGLEIDGPEGTTYTDGLFTLMNGTVYTFGGTEARGDFKSKAQGTINNVSMGEAKIRASYENNCADPKTDAFTHLTQATPTLVFTGSEFSAVSVYTGSEDNQQNACPVPTLDQTAAEAAMTSTVATGADATGFASWTWMGVNGKL
ncbi:MAG: hypothetical protein ACFHU9_07785 [Fluviicola sp.]